MTTFTPRSTETERDATPLSQFPHAPEEWSLLQAHAAADAEGLVLTDAHWEVIAALQEYFARNVSHVINTRGLTDALEERFHARGGMKYLYRLFPGGPVAQGCRIAGLPVPFLAVDQGFGSVM